MLMHGLFTLADLLVQMVADRQLEFSEFAT